MSNYQGKEFSENRKFSISELNWVRDHHDDLKVREEGELLRGLLVFSAHYKDRNKKELKLQGEYKVEIRIGNNNIPQVWEKGGYLQARADELGKDIIDMHVYPVSKKICMGTMPMMKTIYAGDPTIKGIFYNLIIRYFYYHTYWKQEGVEPWDGLKHDIGAIIEDYVDNRNIVCVSEYIKYYLSLDLIKCLDIREMCLCNKYKMKECSCGIMEKCDIFREDLLEFKKNFPEEYALLFNQ